MERSRKERKKEWERMKKRSGKEWKENGKEWKRFLHKHRDSFPEVNELRGRS